MRIDDLISDEYRQLNYELHNSPVKYGSFNDRRADFHVNKVKGLVKKYSCTSILDYGCGKGDLSKIIPCTNYDPCIPKFSIIPEPHDLIVCTDVLEHIEPEKLNNVLSHIHSLMIQCGYFIIATRPDRSKKLPDGSNPHRIIENHKWWVDQLNKYFTIKYAITFDGQESLFEVVPCPSR